MNLDKNLERNRLVSLIEFAQQSARLRSKPATTVAGHNLFSLHEHELRSLPGIQLNILVDNGEDEIWLSVSRLRETRPPEVVNRMLQPWVQVSQSVTEEPRLLQSVSGASLIAAGTHVSSEGPSHPDRESVDPNATVMLAQYDKATQVKALFTAYNEKWQVWATEERLRRRTIRFYSQLFTMKQQLEGSIVEAQLELLWGVGIGVWSCNGTHISYPLVGRLVEMSLNPDTAAVEIRPRDTDPRLELDWYASVGNPGVAELEKAAKDFFSKATTTFSPFDRGTFEPLLTAATAHLDANGVYWPKEVPAEDRALPEPDKNLKVTDTWVLFARPRTNNLFIQDLEKLKEQAGSIPTFPPATTAIITDPETTNAVVELPHFRGMSVSYRTGGSISGKVRDIYFPKPFNEEQVRIIQHLDISDGVIVQGPPGTGKTHTIANAICHYLAEGKRVLVTSMKDPALAVLQEHLPKEIRPLAISLLTSEQDGMKQFEHAIQKIASDVQSLDRTSTQRAIRHIEETIDALHGKLSMIDHKIDEWAKRNLAKIDLEGEKIEPMDAAREVIDSAESFECLPDDLGIGSEYTPQFSDEDVVRLREARRALGQDIDYLDASLPQLIEFPESRTLLEVHQDLSQLEKLKKAVESGEIPALASTSQEALALAHQLLDDVASFRQLRNDWLGANRPWAASMRDRLKTTEKDDLLTILEMLGSELEKVLDLRKKFIERPVEIRPGIETDEVFVGAIHNLAEGRSAFGLTGLFGKSEHKSWIASTKVLGAKPNSSEDWTHVREYIRLLRRMRELVIRWNALCGELQLQAAPDDGPDGAVTAHYEYSCYLKTKAVATAEVSLCEAASQLFPQWINIQDVATSIEQLDELERVLRHHLTKNRLSNVWATKERLQKVLEERRGPIIDAIRSFLAETLGNPKVDDAHMQAEWSDLMNEIARGLRLRTQLDVVAEVCEKVKVSGAPKYAAALRLPLEGTVDTLLPDNWRAAWRLKRLNTYLRSIDAHKELKKLAKDHHNVEADLSRAYQDIVVKRTWLKLAENASPSIRAALQAYLNAIQHIGAGTGKRAVRYRQDARNAAAEANPAVPCWIMPHYRVSESLPAKFGCFDLVIIDEASQSDLSALPSILRAEKLLIVGDDKQVSPDAVGLEEEKIRTLMSRFLADQVRTYRPQMSPNSSIYDLFKVVFAKSAVMLKEHFRSVGPIIEYSKREFYNHELRPLRIPKTSERLDPPLIDVLLEDGYRKGDVNLPEARYIVDEIKAIVEDPAMARRSIGVVSLIGDKQSMAIWDRLTDEIGTEIMERHRIACGDARTFQGKERDIMFLSMVSGPNEVGAPLSRDAFRQRFNVAASRARDRMYLVRSVGLDHLSKADQLRRSLIMHFATPYVQDEVRVGDLRSLCESPFEREVYDELSQRGFWVTPQVKVGQYRIDFVVEGRNDARLAVECDGDKYHGADKWAEDMQRQRTLERAGWVFWRCFGSAFYRNRKEVVEDLLAVLAERGIEPIGAEGAPRSVHVEHRVVSSTAPHNAQREQSGTKDEGEHRTEAHESPRGGDSSKDTEGAATEGHESEKKTEDKTQNMTKNKTENKTVEQAELLVTLGGNGDEPVAPQRPHIPLVHPRAGRLQFEEYVEYAGPPCDNPNDAVNSEIAEGLARIVEVEGPVLAKRSYDTYLRSCGIRRLGGELQKKMNKALQYAIREGAIVYEDELKRGGLIYSIIRLKGTPPVRLRKRGPRPFEEIPPSELNALSIYLAQQDGYEIGSEEHMRAVLEWFDLKRLTVQTSGALKDIVNMQFSYVRDFLNSFL
ncbi:MAG: AAA domain-containing protein [Syntrophorhabdales bacterium]|jgi:very-short-patch-repair endonuclease/DNA-directed RNA polymerase subunit L